MCTHCGGKMSEIELEQSKTCWKCRALRANREAKKLAENRDAAHAKFKQRHQKEKAKRLADQKARRLAKKLRGECADCSAQALNSVRCLRCSNREVARQSRRRAAKAKNELAKPSTD